MLPTPPGPRNRLRLFDTTVGEIRDTTPNGTARMYVCGITPYDATHLGHAATYLAFDLVQRVWRDVGHEVHYVQNVTDVDDPLLERAAHTRENWMHLAEREIALYREDMTALRVLPPDQYVGAVESVTEITKAIAELLASGAAYHVGEDIYFSIEAAEHSATYRITTTRRCSPCSPSAVAIRTTPASATRWTRCCGAGTDSASRTGTPTSAAAVPAGTSSAP